MNSESLLWHSTLPATCIAGLLLLTGCANNHSPGDLYRVDRLIDHRVHGTSAETCIEIVQAGPDQLKVERRKSDCDTQVPPVDLQTFRLPNQRSNRSAFIEALACQTRPPIPAALPDSAQASVSDVLQSAKSRLSALSTAWRTAPLATHVESQRIAQTLINQSEIIGSIGTEVAKSAGINLRLAPELALHVSDRLHALQRILAPYLANLREATIVDANARAERDALSKTDAEVTEVIALIDSLGRILSSDDRQCRHLRDELQSVLMTRSDAICERHKGQIHASATTSNLGFGIATTLLAAGSAVSTGGGAQIAAAGAAATNSARGQFNEATFQNQYAGVITRAIDTARQRIKSKIEKHRALPVAQYGVGEAVSDAQAYHQQCSLYNGLQELSGAIEERRAKDPGAMAERLRDVEQQIKDLSESMDPDSKVLLNVLNAERLRIILMQ